jgi:hypothetical protein
MNDNESKRAKPGRSIADRFAELREILRQENYRLPTAPRTTRENAFVKVLDELERDGQRPQTGTLQAIARRVVGSSKVGTDEPADRQTAKVIDAIVISQADDPTAWEVEAHVKPRRKREHTSLPVRPQRGEPGRKR